MASQKQINANKANAQKSTGPQSMEGRHKIKENALKHGLARGHIFDEKQQSEIDLLVKFLCQGRGDDCNEIAYAVAESQVLLRFINTLEKQAYELKQIGLEKISKKEIKNRHTFLSLRDQLLRDPIALEKFLSECDELDGVPNLEIKGSDVSRMMTAVSKLQRYKRSVLFRRNQAIARLEKASSL